MAKEAPRKAARRKSAEPEHHLVRRDLTEQEQAEISAFWDRAKARQPAGAVAIKTRDDKTVEVNMPAAIDAELSIARIHNTLGVVDHALASRLITSYVGNGREQWTTRSLIASVCSRGPLVKCAKWLPPTRDGSPP